MLTNIVLLGLLTTTPTPRVPLHGAFAVRPRIEVWSNHGDGVYNRGQGVRVYLRSDQDAFVTLFRVDTDGRVRVLFPRDPSEDNFVRGGRDFEILSSDNSTAFYVDDYPGVGYLFGVVAADPFEYAAIESGDHWDYRTIADGRVRGDPYVALTELAERIVPEGYRLGLRHRSLIRATTIHASCAMTAMRTRATIGIRTASCAVSDRDYDDPHYPPPLRRRRCLLSLSPAAQLSSRP
jgi:hypothetical protein